MKNKPLLVCLTRLDIFSRDLVSSLLNYKLSKSEDLTIYSEKKMDCNNRYYSTDMYNRILEKYALSLKFLYNQILKKSLNIDLQNKYIEFSNEFKTISEQSMICDAQKKYNFEWISASNKTQNEINFKKKSMYIKADTSKITSNLIAIIDTSHCLNIMIKNKHYAYFIAPLSPDLTWNDNLLDDDTLNANLDIDKVICSDKASCIGLLEKMTSGQVDDL